VGGGANPNGELFFGFGPSVRGAVCQMILAVVCWNRLLLRLKKRAFPLERVQFN